MKLFDTHAHYNDEKFEEDRYEIIPKIYEEGVENVVVVGDNVPSSKLAVDIAERYDFVYASAGIHPYEIGKSEEEIDAAVWEIQKIAQHDEVVAIGEIGLDYHFGRDNADLQKYAFLKQIEVANNLELPIIIHSRDAIMDTIQILKGDITPKRKGILHCCQLNKDIVKAGLEAGLFISFAGIITFKNAKNAEEIVKMIPDDRILIETDSPYLAPEPHRGERNDSRYVKYVAEKIAEFKGKSAEEIAKITYKNAKKVYNIQ